MRRLTWSLFALAFSLSACSDDSKSDAKPGPGDAGADAPADADVDAGDAAAFCSGPSAVSKGPWVLGVNETSAILRWEACREGGKPGVTLTPEAGGAAAEYEATVTPFEVNNTYISLNPDAPPDEAGTYYMHELSLDSLAPSTCYKYELAEDATLTGRFCTARAPGESFKVLAIGDTNPGLGSTNALLLEAAKYDYDFTVHAGDIEYYASILETWASWFPPMMPMFRQGAFFPCIGNHEFEKPDEFDQYYLRFFGQAGFDGTDEYYRVHSGGVWFFSLDTETDMGAGSDQLAWFTQSLADAAAQPGYRTSVVYLHRPFLTCGPASQKDTERALYQPLFEQYGVSLVLQGHIHGYEHFEVPEDSDPTKSITYLTVGGGGAALHDLEANIDRPTCALRVAKGNFYNFTILEVGPDSLKGQMFDKQGVVQDTWEKTIP